ncbi:MAG: hypothetical protein FD141_718 [Fusobacteria bacterium]|nr:MAG: hypothetical protein FD141_718 [Fusobacteriota bacterium]KAF0228616.1 MAG: hypothetical protein FD182_872 [Fusobacteriota bacterium]
MNIEQLINKDAEKNSPYMGGFINHLPMVKFALFSITNDISKVENYVEYYLNNYNIDKVKTNYEKVVSLEECLGKKELYESCLDYIRNNIGEETIEELVRSTLRKYPLGLSSGLFHTIIRLAYAIEGYELDKKLKPEVERALTYYITGYREGRLFNRKINKEEVIAEMNELMEDKEFKEIRNSNMSLGQKLVKLYNSENYLRRGFIIEGKEEDKVKGILEILMPAFYNSDNIVMLHCITGLQAVIALKDYFEDYDVVLDIFTTTALSHLLTQTDLSIGKQNTRIEGSWDEILKKASESKNIHTIKLAYTCKKLYDLFKVKDLKYIINKRIELELNR